MESDQEPTITDPSEAAWASAERARVIEYLVSPRCEHGGVSLEPRWFLSPYLAIWAVRSRTNPDRIGWRAISEDVPTDYLTCTTERDNADVLLSFSRVWKSAAEYMAKGTWAPNHHIGPPGRQKELAPMLLSRAQILQDFANDLRAGNAKDEG
jgi:hypothetical protein